MADKVNEYWARPFLAIGLAFLLIFALAHMAERQWQQPGGRVIALGFFAVVAVTFIYFYPQLAAWPVSGHLAESYYWFPSWR
jgi:dolichyl-phosphate-mannose--protein O-mannosyl transferase